MFLYENHENSALVVIRREALVLPIRYRESADFFGYELKVGGSWQALKHVSVPECEALYCRNMGAVDVVHVVAIGEENVLDAKRVRLPSETEVHSAAELANRRIAELDQAVVGVHAHISAPEQATALYYAAFRDGRSLHEAAKNYVAWIQRFYEEFGAKNGKGVKAVVQ